MKRWKTDIDNNKYSYFLRDKHHRKFDFKGHVFSVDYDVYINTDTIMSSNPSFAHAKLNFCFEI